MKLKTQINNSSVTSTPSSPTPPKKSWWKRKAYELFGADLRSLALLRVGIGSLILADLLSRAQDLFAHYTDGGVLPRAALYQLADQPWHISLHTISGQWQVQALLFILAGVLAIFLILGCKTRFATIASFILLISLQNRNPIILHNSDTLLRVTLFWAMFLPWGKVFSLDSTLHPGHHASTPEDKQIISVATLGYLAQIIFLYVFAVMFKTSPDWRVDGTAIYYALSDEGFTTSLGFVMLHFPLLMKFTTHAVFWFEAIGPWLLIIPFGTTFFRSAAVLGFIAMHTGIGLTMHLGMFPWTSAIVGLGLLPTGFWDFLQRFRRRPRKRLTLYYDNECGFCLNAAQTIKTFLLLDFVPVASAQNSPSILKKMLDNNSWVIQNERGKLFIKFEAFIVLVAASPIFWPLKYLLDNPVVRPIGKYIYEFVATHRTVACSLNHPMPPRPSDWRLLGTVVLNLTAGFFLFYILMWNISTLPNSTYHFPYKAAWVANLLRLDQAWNMFSPGPPHEDGWYVMPGVLTDGRTTDIFKGTIGGNSPTPVSFAKPARVSASYPDYRWQKYLMNLAGNNYEQYRLYLGQYLCRQWNARYSGPDTLESFEIFYVQETTWPSGVKTPPNPISLWKHECF